MSWKGPQPGGGLVVSGEQQSCVSNQLLPAILVLDRTVSRVETGKPTDRYCTHWGTYPGLSLIVVLSPENRRQRR